jgi:hypothetical protein
MTLLRSRSSRCLWVEALWLKWELQLQLHEFLPGCEVQSYETFPTGITSIEGLNLEIQFKQCSCVSRNYRFCCAQYFVYNSQNTCYVILNFWHKIIHKICELTQLVSCHLELCSSRYKQNITVVSNNCENRFASFQSCMRDKIKDNQIWTQTNFI